MKTSTFTFGHFLRKLRPDIYCTFSWIGTHMCDITTFRILFIFIYDRSKHYINLSVLFSFMQWLFDLRSAK